MIRGRKFSVRTLGSYIMRRRVARKNNTDNPFPNLYPHILHSRMDQKRDLEDPLLDLIREVSLAYKREARSAPRCSRAYFDRVSLISKVNDKSLPSRDLEDRVPHSSRTTARSNPVGERRMAREFCSEFLAVHFKTPHKMGDEMEWKGKTERKGRREREKSGGPKGESKTKERKKENGGNLRRPRDRAARPRATRRVRLTD